MVLIFMGRDISVVRKADEVEAARGRRCQASVSTPLQNHQVRGIDAL